MKKEELHLNDDQTRVVRISNLVLKKLSDLAGEPNFVRGPTRVDDVLRQLLKLKPRARLRKRGERESA